MREELVNNFKGECGIVLNKREREREQPAFVTGRPHIALALGHAPWNAYLPRVVDGLISFFGVPFQQNIQGDLSGRLRSPDA